MINVTMIDGLISLRTYTVKFKKSGTKVPRVVLEDMGPHLDMTVRRTHFAAPNLAKLARRQAKAYVHLVAAPVVCAGHSLEAAVCVCVCVGVCVGGLLLRQCRAQEDQEHHEGRPGRHRWPRAHAPPRLHQPQHTQAARPQGWSLPWCCWQCKSRVRLTCIGCRFRVQKRFTPRPEGEVDEAAQPSASKKARKA